MRNARYAIHVTVIAAALGAASSAGASTPAVYAGVTADKAVELAKRDTIALYLAFGATPQEAAAMRRRMNSLRPTVSRSSCSGSPAWKVTWPDSDSDFVNAKGILTKCLLKVTRQP